MTPTPPSRRGFLALAAATGTPRLTARLHRHRRPAAATAVPSADTRHRLWWRAPADEHSLIEQGLPVGNGRLGALAANDPGLDGVYAGVRAQGADLRPGSNRPLTFGGARTVTVPAGEVAWSDPLPGRIAAGTDLLISLRTPDAAGPATGHRMAMQTSYTGQGGHTAEESGANWTQTTGSWWYIDSVAVRPSRAADGAVVALGDSITDGWQSTTDLNRRWPDYLARRLNAAGGPVQGVANEGISGNKVLADGAGQAAPHRLDRDVLSQPGVRTVFLFEGVNDIKAHTGVTADDLIAGYREIARRAHAAGTCVVAATVAPFKGWPEWDPAAESVRQEVNRFLRGSDDVDAVTDFDRVLRSPYDPERMLPFLDGGDHLHPNDKGMRAMADAVDLDGLDCAR
ncbi:SGNH/GDSL hydrolase family protein [Streptomyces flaveolus]|uniref:SGNH/GDSL hydrolase family protein n=1 Tax=Streptomyces flaveolus TaxID=67297 RepID=UPI0033B99A83